MKHNNKLIILSVILTVILCLTLVSCNDSENESLSTDDTKVESTSVTETTEATTDSETDSTEETTETPETENNEPYEIKVDDYTLLKNENGCYLTFDDISLYKNSSSGGIMVADVEFSSIKEFKDTVTKGLLMAEDKEIVANFSKSGDSIQTCDFNNLYEPILPQGSQTTEVLWGGNHYSFRTKIDSVYYGYFTVCTEEYYISRYESQYENTLNRDNITIIKTEKTDVKDVIQYQTSMSTITLERFTLQSGNKTIIVDKKFIVKGDPSLNPSDTVPSNIRMFCKEGNQYYIMNIDTVYEDPTDEWLLQFGLKRYIENDHEVM